MSEDQTKEALKEALREWLNEQVALFGWWAIRSLGAAALVALVYFIVKFRGISL